MKFFVHVETTYYPYGGTIEADSADEAARAALAIVNESGRLDVAVGVFPIDAGVWQGEQWCADTAHEALA